MQSRKGFLSIDWASTKEFIFLLAIVFLIRTFGFGLYQVPTGSMETTMLVGERFFADKFTLLFSPLKHGDIISLNDPTYVYSKNPVKRLWQYYVWGPQNYTKRIIGVPGDEIRGVIEDGKPVVYRNGEKLHEPYLNKYPLIYIYDRETRSVTPKSYDPSKPYTHQPFYRIDAKRILKDQSNNPILSWPETELPKSSYDTHLPDEFHIKLGPDEYWGMGDNRLGSRDCRSFGPIKKELIHGKIIFRIWSIDSDESWWIVDLIKHPIDFFKRVRWSRFLQWVE